jgi:uncharacterized membrane protein (DUF485 family)
MTHTHGRGAEREADPSVGAEADGASHHPEIDWIAAERSPEFRELVRRRNGFVIPATVFFLAWYFGFIILAGYAPDFMGEEFLVDGLTVGYVLALTQFVMTWTLGWMYLRRSDRVFDPLAKRAAEQALRAGVERPARRFDRTTAEEPAPHSQEVTGR